MLVKKSSGKRHESTHGGNHDEYQMNILEYQAQMEQLLKTSVLFHSSPSRPLPTFGPEEIETGGILGMGGFCVVREVNHINLDPNLNHLEPTEFQIARLVTTESRQFMSKYCQRDDHDRYAIKKLKSKFEDEKHRTRGMMDLAIEAEYLSRELLLLYNYEQTMSRAFSLMSLF